MGNEDLGEHFESIGKLQEAAEHYSRMRQDAGSTRHILDCGQHLAYVSLERRDWASMLTHVSKALGAISAIVDQLDESPVAAYSKALSGIALMGLGHYQEAAASFFQIASGALAIRATMAQVASISDLAVYGSLTALATMDRQALRRNCLDNAKFRDFFETEPHLRKAMSHFVNGRYANCLSILESTRNDYLLDVYLHSHVSALFCMIRNKCITQYFVAFSCATIESLDAAFGQPGQSVEPELVDMICEGALHARIDSKDKVCGPPPPLDAARGGARRGPRRRAVAALLTGARCSSSLPRARTSAPRCRARRSRRPPPTSARPRSGSGASALSAPASTSRRAGSRRSTRRPAWARTSRGTTTTGPLPLPAARAPRAAIDGAVAAWG